MTKLWQYTEAQAEAMSAANAAKVLAEQEQMEEDGSSIGHRELEGYALEYDDTTGQPKKDSSGDYVPVSRGYDVPDAGDIWRHLSKIYSKEKMMKITVEEAESLQPKVREILERKVKGPMEAFKKEASEETKRKYDSADEATKGTILAAWLKSKGKSFDGGRKRKTRKGRKGGRKSRRTTRKH
jgi:ribosomal protein L3